MTFLNPAALWGFLAIFPLVALYFLKVRPARKKTTALFLWEQIFEEKKQNGFLKNFRDLFSLLLMLLSFIFLILAMAGPSLKSADRKSDLVLIIDNSASMNAVENGRSRLSKALEIAENIVTGLSPSQQAVIASINSQLTITADATDNQRELLKGIESIQPGNLPLEIRELRKLYENAGILKSSRLIFLSDGCALKQQNLDHIELFKVGGDVDNIGIAASDITAAATDRDSCSVFFQLAATVTQETPVDILIANGSRENVVKVVPVTVKPGLNEPVIVNVEKLAATDWFVTIDRPDALALDNSAGLVLHTRPPIPVLLEAGSQQNFFERCIRAFAESGQLTMTGDDTGAEIAVAYGAPSVKTLPSVIFGPDGSSPFWEKLGESLTETVPKLVAKNHPLARFTNWESLNFAGARQIVCPENAVVIVENENGVPLLYKTAADGTEAVVVNMKPGDADIYFNVNFPIMLYSMALELADVDLTRNYNLSLGEYIILNRQTVTDPGAERYLNGRRFEPKAPGIYGVVKDDGRREAFAFALNNARESLLNNAEIRLSADPIQMEFPLTELFLILALLLIASECMLYHQRKVG